MPDTYTSPFGTTPQATQLQGGQDLLAGAKAATGAVAKMASDAPGKVAAYQDTAAQNAALPQANALYSGAKTDAFAALDSARQGFAQKYGDPLAEAVANTPGYDPEFLATHPTAPSLITSAAASDSKSAVDMLNSISGYISSAYDKINTGTTQYQNTLKMLIDAQSSTASQFMDMYKTLQSAGLTQKDLLDLKLSAAEQHLKPDVDPKTGQITGFSPISSAPLVQQLANDVMTGNKDFASIDPTMQEAVRVRLTELGTSPDKARTENMASKKWTLKTEKNSGFLEGVQEAFGKPKTTMFLSRGDGSVIYPDKSGHIFVKNLKTGATGTILPSDFDPNLYEPVQ